VCFIKLPALKTLTILNVNKHNQIFWKYEETNELFPVLENINFFEIPPKFAEISSKIKWKLNNINGNVHVWIKESKKRN
jgi:hypothetical protein